MTSANRARDEWMGSDSCNRLDSDEVRCFTEGLELELRSEAHACPCQPLCSFCLCCPVLVEMRKAYVDVHDGEG